MIKVLKEKVKAKEDDGEKVKAKVRVKAKRGVVIELNRRRDLQHAEIGT